jgi:multidrug efflux pump subunit AcrA (membrane-fusion protein)
MSLRFVPEKIELWDINRLVPNAGNARTHSAEQIAEIARSMRAFGFMSVVLLKPEMYGTAAMRISGTKAALFVPEQAIQEIESGTVVFVQQAAGEFAARPVRAGQRMNGEAEILEGLSAPELVVVKGSFLLKSQMLRNAVKDN